MCTVSKIIICNLILICYVVCLGFSLPDKFPEGARLLVVDPMLATGNFCFSSDLMYFFFLFYQKLDSQSCVSLISNLQSPPLISFSRTQRNLYLGGSHFNPGPCFSINEHMHFVMISFIVCNLCPKINISTKLDL